MPNKKTIEEKIKRPSWVEVNLDAIEHNVREIKAYLGPVELLVVVKADAYGLGVVPVARTLIKNGVTRLGVVMLDEAIELRQAGITAPIVNMGAILPEQAEDVLDYDVEQILFSEELASVLSKAATERGKVAKVHYKIDTGMSRYGVSAKEAVAFFPRLALPNLEFVGAMTHFPVSDAVDKSFAKLQILLFENIRDCFQDLDYHIPTWHICNSGGVLDLPEAHFEMVRVGLMVYGYFPSEDVRQPFVLKPAMSVKSKIVALRTIQRGDTVGYGRRFLAEKEEQVAVLPIGYADGYDRRLRNLGDVLLHGQRVPIISGLCMDACFIKVTDIPDVKIGDVVTIMGEDGEESISPHDIGDWIGSVSYEVMSRFGRRLPRVYKKGGQLVEVNNMLVKD